MKKLIISVALIAFGCSLLPVSAVIDSERLLNEDYLRNAGYSPESIRMIKIRSYDPYAPHEETAKGKNYLKRFVQYIDPAAESGRFGTSIIDPKLDRPSQL